MFTLNDARQRKIKLAAVLSLAGIRYHGMGITMINGGYALSVGLPKPVDAKLLPQSVDGMAVNYRVTGEIHAL